MKKKNVPIIIIFIFLGVFHLNLNVRGSPPPFNLIYLNTDKEQYYIDDKIIINASWELNYNIITEISYIQVQIYDNYNNLIWNSSIYDNIGNFYMNWTINIQNLNLSFFCHSINLSVKFYIYLFNIEEMEEVFNEFLEEIEIVILKRTISCQLFGFNNNIFYGDNLKIKARFYDNVLDTSYYLVNHTVEFKIYSEDVFFFEENLTIDDQGIIEFDISSIYLNINQNSLIFLIKNHTFYHNSEFIYNLTVKKAPIFIEIFKINRILKEKEDFKIYISFFYYFNNIRRALVNDLIKIRIFNQQTLIYESIDETNQNGLLFLLIPQEILNFPQKKTDIRIELFFNGTYYLQEKDFTLNSEIIITYQSNLFPFFIIVVILILLFSSIFYNNTKKSKLRNIMEISIKY